MTDVPIAPEDVVDPAEKNQPGIGLGRDPERTPLPWDASPRGGFTTGRPWLPLGDHAEINIASALADGTSLLGLHRRLLQLRRENRALTQGSLEAIAAVGDVLTYERRTEQTRLTIILNLGPEPRTLPLRSARILCSTRLDRDGERIDDTITLRAGEGVVALD